ncbi:MAG: Hsp20/alpha crystallin family protein [Clostridia bacterium]
MAGLIPFNRNNRSSLSDEVFGDFYNVLDDFFSDRMPMRRRLSGDTFKVDIQEDEDNYYVTAELPGISKDEVNITLNDERLNISIEREEQIEDERKNYIHRERKYTSMARNIFLAEADDEKDIKAKLEDGVLDIRVPKREQERNIKQIEIE